MSVYVVSNLQLHKILRHKLQSDDGQDQCADEEQTPKHSGFFEDKYPYQHRANGSNACPYRVGSAKRDGFGSFGQKHHTQQTEDCKGSVPEDGFASRCEIAFAKAECKARFTKPCNN